jgi:Uma2 family endonuclease
MLTLAIPTDAPAVTGPPQGHWTYPDWERLPDDGHRYEVIGGVLYMSTAPSTFHQWIIMALARAIAIPAIDQGLAYILTAPIGLLMPGCDPVQPDLVVVRQARADLFRARRIRGVPDLIVEVFSPRNAAYDRQIKLAAYAAAGLPEYVIVDPATRTLTHCRRPAAGRYQAVATYGETASLAFDCLPTLPLTVGHLFAGAPDTTI